MLCGVISGEFYGVRPVAIVRFKRIQNETSMLVSAHTRAAYNYIYYKRTSAYIGTHVLWSSSFLGPGALSRPCADSFRPYF